MKLQDEWQCPRCGGDIPNSMAKGQYPGALSRYDNQTYVCSECGQIEALIQFGASQENRDPQDAMNEDHTRWYATMLERVIDATDEEAAVNILFDIYQSVDVDT